MNAAVERQYRERTVVIGGDHYHVTPCDMHRMKDATVAIVADAWGEALTQIAFPYGPSGERHYAYANIAPIADLLIGGDADAVIREHISTVVLLTGNLAARLWLELLTVQVDRYAQMPICDALERAL